MPPLALYLLEEHLDGIVLVVAPDGLVAGEGAEPTYLDRIRFLLAAAAGKNQRDRQNDERDIPKFHEASLKCIASVNTQIRPYGRADVVYSHNRRYSI